MFNQEASIQVHIKNDTGNAIRRQKRYKNDSYDDDSNNGDTYMYITVVIDSGNSRNQFYVEVRLNKLNLLKNQININVFI